MSSSIFFYGTLMTPFNRPGRRRIDSHLVFKGRGTIKAAIFDLGIYVIVLGGVVILSQRL